PGRGPACYPATASDTGTSSWRELGRRSSSRRGQAGVEPFTPQDRQRLDAASQALRTSGVSRRILILDRQSLGPNPTVAGLLGRINAFKAQAGATRAFIAIDYLQLLPVPDQVARQGDLEADR